MQYQDFSKILVVLGLQNSGGGGVGTPIRLMTKLIGLRRIRRANVTFRSSWILPKFCPGESLFLGGEGAARFQIASC